MTWAVIPGYEGWYSASADGLIRADYALAARVNSGRTRSLARRGGIIRGSRSGNGHLQANIRNADGTRHAEQVHRLVALAFLGPVPEGHEVNHRNGDKADNRAENLEYSTHRANMQHAADTLGMMARKGSANGRATLNEATAVQIRAVHAGGTSRQDICARYSLGKHVVNQLLSGRTWKHVKAAA